MRSNKTMTGAAMWNSTTIQSRRVTAVESRRIRNPWFQWQRATPNDPKLSDGGAWRGSCEGGAQREATDVGQSHDRTRRVQARIAATVTRGAVRCSAWLGVAVVRRRRSKNMKVLEDDCETRWATKKLELSGKVAPLACERNGAIKRVTAPVGEGDEAPMPVW